MPEMPIEEQDPTAQQAGPEDEEGLVLDLDDEFAEVEEQPDGSAIVRMDEFKGPKEDQDFYANLAEEVEDWNLDKIALKYIDLIEKDQEARKERDKQYEEGLRRTGLGHDAPGGATFTGASKVVHPVMAEACIDFESRAIKELFPPDGPVRTNIIGDVDEESEARADRKRDYMNWQLTEQIEEFRDEQEQMLTQLPLGGSQFMKLWYDEKKRRPCAEFVPIDNIMLPFSAASFYTAQRVTEVQDITQEEFDDRISRGLYKDVAVTKATQEPTMTASEKANDKIEGKQWQDNEDGVRRVYHIYTNLALDDDSYSKGELAPYILMIDDLNTEVLGLYRNWEEGDESMAKLDWLVEYKFIPWRGAYAIGLPHLIGGLTAALTGSLRALLDTAHINNAATMLKLKGAKISGQSQQVEVTQVTEIEGAPGVDDIRKLAMPMPFNPPSPVLLELLGFLTTAAKGVVTTSEEKVADVNSNAPVGTTQALIEQGAAVFSAIHARLHNSQRKLLMVLQRINRWYLDDQRKGDVVQELQIKREDFNRNTDVLPVSDPHIFSETQRMAQAQAVLALTDKFPELFDRRAVVQRMLKQMKIPNITELMPAVAEPMEINAAEENAAMCIGRAAFAYPHQNQLAHLQAHLDFALNPMLGGSMFMAPTFMPMFIEHFKQHVMLWYLGHMNGYVEQSLGKPVKDYDIAGITGEIDKLYALASQHTKEDSEIAFKQVMPALQQIMQLMQQLKPKPEMDPGDQVILQTSMAETERRKNKDMGDLAVQQARLKADMLAKNRQQQIDIALNASDRLTEERIKSAELTHDAAILQHEQQQTALAAQQSAQQALGGLNGIQ
jgi:chaperonin GroES